MLVKSMLVPLVEATVVPLVNAYTLRVVEAQVVILAVPDPTPTPVAVKIIPIVLADAPINVKSVDPSVRIEYSTPTTKLPAVTVEPAVDINELPNVPGLTAKIALVLVAPPTNTAFGVADEFPVPPEATGNEGDKPLIVPPVIATALAFCEDIVPKEPVTKAVVAICVVFVPAVAVGAVGVPENAGLARLALDVIAEAIAVNSVSISVPLTILPELPEGNVSLAVKLVDFV
jgi:hypothetical protein